MRSHFIKRSLDFTSSLFGLIVLSPFLAIIAVIVFIAYGSPVFFRQTRVGFNGKTFCLIKFRTMTNRLDRCGEPLPDEQRLTSLGRFLRKWSLDELPELYNVLTGSMSIVGPRPLLLEYLPLYSPEQMRRHDVKPGLTGWAQINGRNAVSWEKRFEMDVWYVDNWNLWLDIRIIFMTLMKVICREGISAESHVTMPKFTGAVTNIQK